MVPAAMLMCKDHWHLVPKPIGDAVWREYKRAPRSEAHYAAMKAAVDAVHKVLPGRILDAVFTPLE